MLVIDASVSAKWFIIEPGRPQARRLLERDEPLIAPELVVAEVVNVVWKRLMAGTIDPIQAPDPGGRGKLFAELVAIGPLAERALAIAEELRHPAYDSFYLALERTRTLSGARREQELDAGHGPIAGWRGG